MPGEPRNADLVGIADSRGGRVAVNVEAKADESFGPIIKDRLAQVSNSPASKVPARIEGLCTAVLGQNPDACGHLRHQLIHVVAGSLIYAREQLASVSVFVVYVFRSSACSHTGVATNMKDLQRFLAAIGGPAEASEGILHGPYSVPGGGLVSSDIPLYIGKVHRAL